MYRAVVHRASAISALLFVLTFVFKFYCCSHRVIKKDLTQFCEQVSNIKLVTGLWLFAAPLLHFLNGDCKPCEWPDVAVPHNHKSGQWWGIQALSEMKKNSQEKTIQLVFRKFAGG